MRELSLGPGSGTVRKLGPLILLPAYINCPQPEGSKQTLLHPQLTGILTILTCGCGRQEASALGFPGLPVVQHSIEEAVVAASGGKGQRATIAIVPAPPMELRVVQTRLPAGRMWERD